MVTVRSAIFPKMVLSAFKEFVVASMITTVVEDPFVASDVARGVKSLVLGHFTHECGSLIRIQTYLFVHIDSYLAKIGKILLKLDFTRL